MSIAEKILVEIKDFLDGKTDAEEFSFDFPDDLVDTFNDLEKENAALAELLNNELPEICSYFEPEENARSQRPEYLDEEQFRAKVKEAYEKAIKLV